MDTTPPGQRPTTTTAQPEANSQTQATATGTGEQKVSKVVPEKQLGDAVAPEHETSNMPETSLAERRVASFKFNSISRGSITLKPFTQEQVQAFFEALEEISSKNYTPRQILEDYREQLRLTYEKASTDAEAIRSFLGLSINKFQELFDIDFLNTFELNKATNVPIKHSQVKL